MADIKVPLSISIKVYSGLTFALALLFSLFYILYYFGGWILLFIGFIPLLLVLFIKPKPSGILMKKKEQPRLVNIVEKLSTELNVDCPHEILLRPDSEISVSGIFKKRLNIGIAGLRSLSCGQFRAILSHEFSHFYGKDTIIGGFLWRIDYSLEQTAEFGAKWWEAVPILQLAAIGMAILLFYKIYHVLFSIILHGYSRQMEFRADFLAAQIAGQTNFHEGLLNYSVFTKYFDTVAYEDIADLLAQNKMFINVYDYTFNSFKKRNTEKLKRWVLESEKAGWFSSHPPLKSRLKRIPSKGPATERENATTLFKNFRKIEKDMSQIMTQSIHQQITLHQLYTEAQAREGRCKHCGKQYEYLKDLLEHEAKHQEPVKSE